MCVLYVCLNTQVNSKRHDTDLRIKFKKIYTLNTHNVRFNEKLLISCCVIAYVLVSIIVLVPLFQGEHFGTTEATEAFFAMTRLFQSNDVRIQLFYFPLLCSVFYIFYVITAVFPQQTLRRMCYLTIKEMANISEDVIIVTSRFGLYSLVKKINFC